MFLSVPIRGLFSDERYWSHRTIQASMRDARAGSLRGTVNIIRLFSKIIVMAALALICSCATHDSLHPSLPVETTMNKAAGRGIYFWRPFG
jgi:hypothetical protein